MNRNKRIQFLTQSALIAAMYVALVATFNFWSFGVIQFRIAEVLTVLPFFTSAAIPGLFVGCLLSNLLLSAVWTEVLFGSLATLAAALLSYLLRKHPWLVPLPPVLCNTLTVPLILKYGYGAPETIPYMMVTVFIGEAVVCYLLGGGAMLALKRLKGKIF